MNEYEQSLKKPAIVALAALGILLVLGIIFFKERLFADTSFMVFNIINYKSISIQNQRYGSFITQIIPYLGQKMHLPIKMILIGYSSSFNVFFLTVALLMFRYKHYGLTILMTFYYYLLVSDSFFWAYDELHQAIAWMFLFFSVTLYLGKKKTNVWLLLPVASLLASLAISTHFIAIIATVFLWVYLILENKRWAFSKNASILLSCFLIAIIVLKFILAHSQPYENSHLHAVTKFTFTNMIYSVKAPEIKLFLSRCLTNYWVAVIIFFVGMASLIHSKKYILATWTLLSSVGYLILMGLTYSDVNNRMLFFHIETEWQSMGIIIAAPFVFSFLPKLQTSKAIWLLILVFMIRLGYITTAIPAFTWRTHFIDRVLSQMDKKGIAKLALYQDSTLRSECIVDWAFTYETLLTSAMKGDTPQRTFFIIKPNDNQTQKDIVNPKSYYNAFDVMLTGQLNSQYFIIDTSQPYQIMTCEQLFK